MKYLKTYQIFEIIKPPGAYYSSPLINKLLSIVNIDELEITNTIRDVLIPLQDKNYRFSIDKDIATDSSNIFRKKEFPALSIKIESDSLFYINNIEEELLSFENYIKAAGSRILEISYVYMDRDGELVYNRKFKSLNDLLKSKKLYLNITIKVFLDINIDDYI